MSGLRIAILTTDTAHHRYFLRRLSKEKPKDVVIGGVLFERQPYLWRKRALRHFRSCFPNIVRGLLLSPYIQPRSLGRSIEAWERRRFFPDGDDSLPDSLACRNFWSVSDAESSCFLASTNPDLIVIYGTQKVSPDVLRMAKLGSINAHGGRLPDYRGLDTNLWAVLEGRPQDLCVTWHVAEAEFDTGVVLTSRNLPKARDLDLFSLRGYAAVVCTELLIELLPRVKAKLADAVPQKGEGRYFGPMPYLLKRKAGRLLREWVAA